MTRTIRLLCTERRLWIPFVISASFELFALLLLWLAPHPPFSRVLAPPIRYFAGERVLHYPWHLWFIYHSMRHTNVAAATLIGAFMSGLVCVMVRQSFNGSTPSLRQALVSKQVRYGTVTILWLVTWGLAKVVMGALSRFAPPTLAVLWSGIGVLVVLQALLVYAIPAAVYERLHWWRALGRSVRETLRYPFSTLVLAAIGNALVIAFGIFCSERRVAMWMQQAVPEIAPLLVIVRLVVLSATDALVTVSVANLWLVHRAKEASQVVVSAGASLAAERVSPGPSVA